MPQDISSLGKKEQESIGVQLEFEPSRDHLNGSEYL